MLACADVRQVGLAMDPLLAPRLVVEVLDGVRHIHSVPIDRRAVERPVEDPPGGTDERVPLAVLAVARLFADQQDAGGGGPFSEHGLRALAVQLAIRATRRRTS